MHEEGNHNPKGDTTMTDDTVHAKIRQLLEDALELMGTSDDAFYEPMAAIHAAQGRIEQAAAAAKGYLAIQLEPASFR